MICGDKQGTDAGHYRHRTAGETSCPPCRTAHLEHRRTKETPVHARRWYLWSTYRMTEQTFADLLSQQNNKCAICSTSEPRDGKWCVDHDHSCCPEFKSCGSCVRGILCGACNVMLGQAKDNPDTLRRAVTYLGG